MGLTIAITGAGGFIGTACVNAALKRGHHVRALIRRDTPDFAPEVSRILLDLSKDEAKLASALKGVDAVIHTAASLRGNPETMARDTVKATENLLNAMRKSAPDARLVLVSSITVYDADAFEITEDTPLDPSPTSRDIYAQAKLAQEACLKAYDGETWIARPGAVFGPHHLWNAHLGHCIGPLLIRLGGPGEIPAISVENCADALVLAAETPVTGNSPRALNLVDSDLPDRTRYLAALGNAAPRFQLPLSWKIPAVVGKFLSMAPPLANRLPGLLHPRTLRARMGEKRYSNARAEQDLNWHPRQPFEATMRTAVEASQ
ncbi:NAD(P)-dependent oxidoreductase [Rhodobacteraceae bacterium LMO-12]|nr:NAD(P)-dependent oxidoreductase [Rhodobacteraceae bacterium LMO-JJ12]